MEHPSHKNEINRINRLIGQLEGVKKMIEEKAYCPEILIQTKAITSAIRGLETSLLEKHIQHCVKNNLQNDYHTSETIEELVNIFKTRIK